MRLCVFLFQVSHVSHKVSELSSADMGASFAAKLKYLGDTKFSPLSLWTVADLESEEGRHFVEHALEHLSNSNNARVAVIYNNKDAKVGQYAR